eukprot:UN3403
MAAYLSRGFANALAHDRERQADMKDMCRSHDTTEEGWMHSIAKTLDMYR